MVVQVGDRSDSETKTKGIVMGCGGYSRSNAEVEKLLAERLRLEELEREAREKEEADSQMESGMEKAVDRQKSQEIASSLRREVEVTR